MNTFVKLFRRFVLVDEFLTRKDTPLTDKVLRRYPYRVSVFAREMTGKDVKIVSYSKGGKYLVDTLRTYLADYPGCCIEVDCMEDYRVVNGALTPRDFDTPPWPFLQIYVKGHLSHYYGAPFAPVTVPISLRSDEMHEDVVRKTLSLAEYVLQYCPTLPLT